MSICPVCGPIVAGFTKNGMASHVMNAHTCRCGEEEDHFHLFVDNPGRQWIMCYRCGAYWPIPNNIVPVDVAARIAHEV